jgi:hypothetical protein
MHPEDIYIGLWCILTTNQYISNPDIPFQTEYFSEVGNYADDVSVCIYIYIYID